MQRKTLSVKPNQNVNTHSKYGYTFRYNLNVNQNPKFRLEENAIPDLKYCPIAKCWLKFQIFVRIKCKPAL
jgi:hypothetical protein